MEIYRVVVVICPRVQGEMKLKSFQPETDDLAKPLVELVEFRERLSSKPSLSTKKHV